MGYQINDYGFVNATYSYKNIYDAIELKNKIDKKLIIDEKYTKRFFLITNTLGITDEDIEIEISDKIFFIRLFLKKRFKLYMKFDYFLCKIVKIVPLRLVQFYEFTMNKNYRRFVINKLF